MFHHMGTYGDLPAAVMRMGDMKRRIIAVTAMDETIEELARRTDHVTLALWAADCAERALPYFEQRYAQDVRPRQAIAACRRLSQTRVFRMADIRGASLAAHAAARATEDDAARSAARAAGQAVATAHVPAHAIAAARYAATAVRDAVEMDAEHAATDERSWQYQHLIALREE
jgi:hypothetical protein